MSTEFIVMGVIVLGLGLAILNHCRKIRSDLEWLQARFVSERGRHIDLASEFEKLAPLCFLPLADVANEIRRASDAMAEEFDRTLRYWERLELKELEAFAVTKASYDKPFVPSQDLKGALKRWSVVRHKVNVVSEWESLFRDVFLSLMSGKLNVTDAKQRLKDVKQLVLFDIDSGRDPEAEKIVEEIFKEWTSKLGSGLFCLHNYYYGDIG